MQDNSPSPVDRGRSLPGTESFTTSQQSSGHDTNGTTMSDDLRRAYLLGDGHSLYGNLPGDNPASSIENATPAYAFAAMPRSFENQNDPWYHGRTGGRPSYLREYKIVEGRRGTQPTRKDVVRHTCSSHHVRRLRTHKMSNLWSSNTPSSQLERATENGSIRPTVLSTISTRCSS
jgi:hypothetical protein